MRDPVLILASDEELTASQRVWGTGGWMQPEEREALDWLTLVKLLGWGATVVHRKGLTADSLAGRRWLILALEPESIVEDTVALLYSRLAQEPLLVVTRAGATGSALAELAGVARSSETIAGQSLSWREPHPHRHWRCGQEFETDHLKLTEEAEVWATIDDAPLIAARKVGRGHVATLGFHPSEARDRQGAATALLKHLLICGVDAPVAWLDLENILVLRMDDPGGAQNIYSHSWYYPKLGEAEWKAIGLDLKERSARLSIGYVSGWVDDGDATRGDLRVAGELTQRALGRVYPSQQIQYLDKAGHAPGTLHDYESEYRGIQALRSAGLADVELHGYTHIHPDFEVWAKAPDRYETYDWYRELGAPARRIINALSSDQHPLALGIAALKKFFGTRPTTLICPGDQWTNEVIEQALNLNLHLVSSYYLALRHDERFCWAMHVCAPYLNEPDAAWFDSGLPVVGYFHDREPSLEGVGWMSRWLDAWRDAGAQRMIDFRELAAMLGHHLSLETVSDGLRLIVSDECALQFVRPVPIMFRANDGRVPSHVTVLFEDKEFSTEVKSLDNGFGHLELSV